MPLRLVNKQRMHIITACDTEFKIISMTIGEKEKLIYDLFNVGGSEGAFERLLDVIAPAIVKITGYDQPVRTVLSQLVDSEQLREIMQAVIAHCNLTDVESKNSHSLSAQPIPASAGNAARSVEPDDGPVSTTPTKKDS